MPPPLDLTEAANTDGDSTQPALGLSNDDHQVAVATLNSVVRHALTLNEGLSNLADASFAAAAPVSLRVLELNRTITRSVLDWIEQWP